MIDEKAMEMYSCIGEAMPRLEQVFDFLDHENVDKMLMAGPKYNHITMRLAGGDNPPLPPEIILEDTLKRLDDLRPDQYMLGLTLIKKLGRGYDDFVAHDPQKTIDALLDNDPEFRTDFISITLLQENAARMGINLRAFGCSDIYHDFMEKFEEATSLLLAAGRKVERHLYRFAQGFVQLDEKDRMEEGSAFGHFVNTLHASLIEKAGENYPDNPYFIRVTIDGFFLFDRDLEEAYKLAEDKEVCQEWAKREGREAEMYLELVKEMGKEYADQCGDEVLEAMGLVNARAFEHSREFLDGLKGAIDAGHKDKYVAYVVDQLTKDTVGGGNYRTVFERVGNE